MQKLLKYTHTDTDAHMHSCATICPVLTVSRPVWGDWDRLAFCSHRVHVRTLFRQMPSYFQLRRARGGADKCLWMSSIWSGEKWEYEITALSWLCPFCCHLSQPIEVAIYLLPIYLPLPRRSLTSMKWTIE